LDVLVTSSTVDLKNIAFLVGMPRAGTNFLYHNLQKHPQIFAPVRREINFLSLHADKSVAWFLDHFSGMRADQVGFDTESLDFLNSDFDGLTKLHALNPDAKVILVVRAPGDWAVSTYKYKALFDRAMPPFEAFLDGHFEISQDGRKFPFKTRQGDIEAKIREAMRLFGPNLLLMNFRLVATDPLLLLRSIEEFLGLDSYFSIENIDQSKINPSDRPRSTTWLDQLLRNQLVLSLIGLLPRRVVLYFRGVRDRMSAAPQTRQAGEKPLVSADAKLAAAFYASDEAFVRGLFAHDDVRRG
jgi:hypothetical protein